MQGSLSLAEEPEANSLSLIHPERNGLIDFPTILHWSGMDTQLEGSGSWSLHVIKADTLGSLGSWHWLYLIVDWSGLWTDRTNRSARLRRSHEVRYKVSPNWISQKNGTNANSRSSSLFSVRMYFFQYSTSSMTFGLSISILATRSS